MATTHLAGPLVVFKKLDRIIQRCAVCGEVLEDMIPSRMATIGQSHGIPQFPEAHLIEVTEGNPKHFLNLGDFREVDLPDNFCLALVERC